MAATLTDSQLKATLTNEQIVAARTKGLSAAETVDPVQEEIDAALAKVDTYCAGYDVPPGMLTSWARGLASHNVAMRLGTPTESQVRIFELVNKELEQLRDGKFANIPRIESATTGKVSRGSREKIL